MQLTPEDRNDCDCCEPDPRECDQCGGGLPGMTTGLCPTCQREAMGDELRAFDDWSNE